MLTMRGFRVPGLMAGAALMSLTAAADPAPGRVNATTYLHDGPGRHFRVVDELATGTAVQVLTCAQDWCRVQSGDGIGYLPQASLVSAKAVPAATPVAKPDGEACVESTDAGSGAGLRYRYCRH
jgi:uncharacterized protein YgiM (DUF1202 family)